MADVQEAEIHFRLNLSLSQAPHNDSLFLLDSVIVLNLQSVVYLQFVVTQWQY